MQEQSREHSSLKERLEENKRIIAEREKENAHRPGGRLFPGPSRYRRGAGGPPAPARAAWTAGGGLKNTPPPA